MRRWAALFCVAVVAFLCVHDLPDRLLAEKNGARQATVTGYHEADYQRRPWRVEALGADGEVFRSSEYWSFRWLKVGEPTEITQNRRTYVGGFLLRFGVYVVGLPVILLLAAWDRIRQRRA